MHKRLCDHIHDVWSITEIEKYNVEERKLILIKINQYLKNLSAEDRIIWCMEHFPGNVILSSSFGIQSVVSLHLITRFCDNIPIVFIDTGYLFPETYRFVDKLTDHMKLNLHIFRAQKSAAWQEAQYGKLWEQGIDGIKLYNKLNKVEPMRFALKSLKVNTWFAGLRRQQSYTRKNLSIVDIKNKIFKCLPIIDWNNHQIYRYIQKYSLEYHPLWTQGYVSIGDIHTSRKLESGLKEEETRFFGLQRECGIHVMD